MGSKVALVTGAGRGIGRATACALAQTGWNIVIDYRTDQLSALETQKAVEAAGVQNLLIQADIGHTADRQRLVDQVIAIFGRLDLLVNNAGVAPRQRLDLLETTEDSYDEVMNVNLKGPFFLTQSVARLMIEGVRSGIIPEGQIINIGSISAYTSSVNRAEYCLSKAGLTMLTRLYADRLADEGVRVYEIQAGIIATEMTGPASAKYDRLIAEGLTPIRRWGQPEDVAQAVAMIANGALPFSTGEIVHVDGGFHLRRL
jgi:3-oxoacyl-[acyl-carrier protein] reductase